MNKFFKATVLASLIVSGNVFADRKNDIAKLHEFFDTNKVSIEAQYDASNGCKTMVKILGRKGLENESCQVMLRLEVTPPNISDKGLTMQDAVTDDNKETILMFLHTTDNLAYIHTRIGL